MDTHPPRTSGAPSFGELLRRYRLAAGLTQGELAERAGLSLRGVNALELGDRRAPRKDTVGLLTDALSLGPDDRGAFEAAARRGRAPESPAAPTLLPAASSPAPLDLPPLPPLPPTPEARPHNLPAQPSPLLGRERELAEVTTLLRREDVRLVTLTGPGGTGKTRVALQIAADLRDAFPAGVWFVRLSRLSDPALVVPTIAQTLDLSESRSQPIGDALRAYLRGRRVLLLLDNFEHVAGAAPEVADLLESSPDLKVLVTSRSVLHLRGEHDYPVPPLSVPPPEPARLPPPERLVEYAAVALFIERAHSAQPSFRVTPATAPHVAAICARLDGLPLAIELAAARVTLLPPTALLKRLERRLPVLTGGARDLPERQQTMRNAIAWSDDLLELEERRLFRRLAVFVGGCTLEAAEAICTAPPGAARLRLDVLDGLGALVDKSLVQQREEAGEPRFALLQVVREYATERLEDGGEADALRRAHAAYYLRLAEEAEPGLTGPEQGRWLDRLERDHDNLRAALTWAREQGDAELGQRLAGALGRFWYTRCHLSEGRGWLEGMLAIGGIVTSPGGADGPGAERAGLAVARAKALDWAGTLAWAQGAHGPAMALLEESLTLSRGAGDRARAASALVTIGDVARERGDRARAASCYAESLALSRELGDTFGIARALFDLGALDYYQGDLERAAPPLEESLALMRKIGASSHIAQELVILGGIALARRDFARATTLHRESLALHRELGDLRRVAESLEALAALASARGQVVRAARLLGAATALRETLGAPQPSPDRAGTEAALAPARAALGEAAWAATVAAGRGLPLDDALAEASMDEPRPESV